MHAHAYYAHSSANTLTLPTRLEDASNTNSPNNDNIQTFSLTVNLYNGIVVYLTDTHTQALSHH